MSVTIYGDLEGGLRIIAPMPMHLSVRNPRQQQIVLTQGDSIELARQLSAMFQAYEKKQDENMERVKGIEPSS